MREITAERHALHRVRASEAAQITSRNDPPAALSSLAIPRQRHVLTTVAETYGRPIREAAATLRRALSPTHCAPFVNEHLSRRAKEPGAWIVRSSPALLAWSLVAVWLTAFATRATEPRGGLREAARWFFPSRIRHELELIPKTAWGRADRILSTCRNPDAYLQLLPYVLDPHGPGSRMSIRRDAATRIVRDDKRSQGAYYTPADVASYMVDTGIAKLLQGRQLPAVYDPACGTAVFLRAALAALKRAWPAEHSADLSAYLYGTDIDPLALQASAFVLLADCLAYEDERPPPFETWHRLRVNLACVDALCIDPPASGAATSSKSGTVTREPPITTLASTAGTRLPLSCVFPDLTGLPLAIVGNPPYNKLGSRSDFDSLATHFATLAQRAGPSSEAFPLFVEQMVRLTRTTPTASTMVVPLSLACNVRHQFTALRSLIEHAPGDWKFAFFDREPHALFGEDVKTRNTILFRERLLHRPDTTIHSGPLRKWRSADRWAMFRSIRFTRIDNAIKDGIPKVDGTVQACAFDILAGRPERFGRVYTHARRQPLSETVYGDAHTVYVGSTAYNFLSVFLAPATDALPAGMPLSENPIHAIKLPSEEHALAAFAILSSRVAYWWWRVTQDGFHVPALFLADFPLGPALFNGTALDSLSTYGDGLWASVKEHPVTSSNRGKTSVAYSAVPFDQQRDEIDATIASLSGIDTKFVDHLRQFTVDTIAASTPDRH